jgi:hypothetical protein
VKRLALLLPVVVAVAEPVNAKASRISRFSIGSVTNQSRAKQWRNCDVIITLRQMKAVSRIGDGELGVAAIDCVTGEARVVAKILSTGSAIRAIAIGPPKPRNSDAVADREFRISNLESRIFLADFFNTANNLVTENQRQFRIEQFAIDHVKVSAANRAGADAH